MQNSQMESYVRELKQVFYLTSTMQKYTDLKQLLNHVLKECISITKATGGSIMFKHRQSDRLFFYVTSGLSQEVLDSTNMRVGDGIAGTVIAEGIPKIINDISLDPKYVTINSDVRSEMAVPIIVDQAVLGVVVLDHTDTDMFTDRHLELVQMICSYTGFIISYHIQKLSSEKHIRLLDNILNVSSLSTPEDIFKTLTKELKAADACIVNKQGAVILQEGSPIEKINIEDKMFEHSYYEILKTENPQHIPYTRIVIPRIQKDMVFIADKIYHFSDNVQVDIDFADKILEFLTTKDAKFHHDETLTQWAERKMNAPEGQVYDLAIGSVEKELITVALNKYRYNRLKTAKFLGINRNTLRHKMEIFGLEK